MARKGARTVIRYVKSKSKRRGSKNGQLKSVAKKAAMGAALGLAVSVPLTLLAKHQNMPVLMEVGQRGGSILSAAVGGGAGNAGYQVADALFDRFVVFNNSPVSGQGSQVYL